MIRHHYLRSRDIILYGTVDKVSLYKSAHGTVSRRPGQAPFVSQAGPVCHRLAFTSSPFLCLALYQHSIASFKQLAQSHPSG